MFKGLIGKLDSIFAPSIDRLEEIVRMHSFEYQLYPNNTKDSVAATVSVAIAMKNFLDTPILDKNCNLTSESEETYNKMIWG